MTPTRVAGPGRRSSAPVAPSSAEPAVYSRLHSLSAEPTEQSRLARWIATDPDRQRQTRTARIRTPTGRGQDEAQDRRRNPCRESPT